jgi:general secretion pathway protein E
VDNIVNLQVKLRSPPDGIVGKPVCQRLIELGKLDSGSAERALSLQTQGRLPSENGQPAPDPNNWEPIGSILVKLGLVSERDLAECLAEQLNVRLVTREEFPADLPAPKGISRQFLEDHRIVVIDETETELVLVMASPQDSYQREALELFFGERRVVGCLGIPSEIEATLQSLRDGADDTGAQAEGPEALVQLMDDVEQLRELAGEAPVIKLVNQIIRNAAECGASDIHIEPFEAHLTVRYRVDGMLREVNAPPPHYTAAIISRVKIMADMNIAERRLSQDGRFRQRVSGEEFDVRVSTVPTMHGESVVMRLLRREQVEFDFHSLGFSTIQEELMRDLLDVPHGIVLVTGPTGSGKSTTIYAALKHLHSPERMIITVEDPVEYNIRGINQMQAKPQIGFTFANALRSIVRQDPDVIMVGEMRDAETAQIAVQSALTGHLVLSTLHTNDAAGSITRMLDMGVQDYLVTSAVNAVQAQRLVRTLCHACRQLCEPVEDPEKRARLDELAPEGKATIYEAVGCEQCEGTGYSGRTTILEILEMTDSMRELVLQRPDATKIAAAAVAEGMVPMRQDGLKKIVAGITTVDEVLRVTAGQR